MKKLKTLVVLFILLTLKLNAQVTYTQTIGPFYWISSLTPFTFTGTPPTTGGGWLVYSWGACWQSGFPANEMHIYFNTSTGSQQVAFSSSNVACSYILDSAYISGAVLSDAIATGGGTITGTMYGTDMCVAGWGCSSFTDPAIFGMSLTYTSHSANFTSATNAVCPNGQVQFTDQSINAPTSWQWTFSGGNPNTSTLQNPVVTYNSPGAYDVTLIASNGVYTDTITYNNFITVYAPPIVNAGMDTTICYGNSVTLNASGGVGYVWYPPVYLSNDSISNPVATPINTTIYTVTVTDANGCNNSDTVTITVNPLPFLITSAAPNPICLGDSAMIGVVGAQTYTWTPASSLSTSTGQSVFAHPFNTTTYTVTGTDFIGCVNTDTITIVVNPLPPSPAITPLGGSLVCSPANGYQWYLNGVLINGATSQAYVFSQNGVYTVMISDANGCKSLSLPYSVTNTGIQVLADNKNTIAVIPNPTEGIFTVITDVTLTGYELLDVRGKIIFSEKISSKDLRVDISRLDEGCYFLKLISEQTSSVSQIVKLSK